MVDPRLLCRQHLLGEHGEIHKHRPSFVKEHSIDGRISPVVQIEPAAMKRRHDLLAAEMVRRGGNHNSPYEMPDLSYLPPEQVYAKANVLRNLKDLLRRCPDCRKRVRMLVDDGVLKAGWLIEWLKNEPLRAL